MAGRPIAGGRGRRPRQRVAAGERRRAEHIARWAAARTPAQRLAAVAETAQSLTGRAGDRYGDHAEINALLDRTATELHRQLRGVFERRTRR